MKILIVDDEPFICQNLAKIVAQLNPEYQIAAIAYNGEKALRWLEETEVDVLITDIRMPGMSGVELARTVFERYPAVQIAILSGYAEFEYARSAIDSGVVSYLLKPTKLAELRAALEKMHARYLEQQSETTNEPQTPDEPQEGRAVVRKITQLVESQCGADLSLNRLSELVHLNPAYLSTLFHKETGEKLKDYITRVRMQQAARLLREKSHLRVYEVAQQVGYDNVKHFITVFRETNGLTPSQYRDQHAK